MPRDTTAAQKCAQDFHKSDALAHTNQIKCDDELFGGMVDRRKVFSLISSRDHSQISSPSRISDTPRAGFEPA